MNTARRYYWMGLVVLLGLLVAPGVERGTQATGPPLQSQQQGPVVQGGGSLVQPEGRRPAANRLYGSVGMGFVNLDRGVGIGIPVGFTALLGRYRLIGTANLLDVGLLEGDDRDPRYYRPYLGNSLCVDARSGWSVPNYYCSGGTDALLSSSVDLSYIIFDEVWISDKPGRLFAGIGHRFAKPQTLYGTIGIFFDTRSRGAGGAKLNIGEEYMSLGIVWGLDLLSFFRKR